MAKLPGFAEILIRRGIISSDQFQEADRMAKDERAKVEDVLVRLGYATGEEVMRAVAEATKYPYVNLSEVSIPESVIELVPESVARENKILPMSEEEGVLT